MVKGISKGILALGLAGLILPTSLYASGAVQDVVGVGNKSSEDYAKYKAQAQMEIDKMRQNGQTDISSIQNQGNQFDLSNMPQLTGATNIPGGSALPTLGTPGGTTIQPGNGTPAKPDVGSTVSGKTIQEKYEAYMKELNTLKDEFKKVSKSYSKLEGPQKAQADQIMQNLKDRIATLDALKKQMPEVTQGDYNPEAKIAEIANALDAEGREKFKGMSGNVDQGVVKQFEETKKSAQEDKKDSDSDDKKDGDKDSKDDKDKDSKDGDDKKDEEEPKLSPKELVQQKCGASVGSRNGLALVEHLTKGECGQALSASPELRAEYNIDGIASLIASFGYKTATFSGATNSRVGIDKLAELGIFLDLNNPNGGLSKKPFKPATAIQGEVKVATADKDQSGPLPVTGTGKPEDKALNNSGNLRD